MWHYSGDVNLEHGGIFVNLDNWKHGYCDAVRVTDLDSGCGFQGAVLVEHITILGTRDSKRIRQALRSCGSMPCRGATKEQSRLMIAEALASYGYYDPDDAWDNYRSHHTEVLQCDDGPMSFDGWKADKRLRGTTLEAYVHSQHLRG